MHLLKSIVIIGFIYLPASASAQYAGQLSANPYAVPQYQAPPAPSYGPPPVLRNQSGQFQGNLSNNQYDPNSVSNPYGKYGSQHSPSSINNQYGAGSQYAPESPNNPYGQGLGVYKQ